MPVATPTAVGLRTVTSPTAATPRWVRRWSVGVVVTIGCTMGVVDRAGAGTSSVPAGTVPPCVIEIEVGPGETMPSTTLPGTCSISATSGTVPAPPVVATAAPPVTVPSVPAIPAVPSWSSSFTDRLVVMRYAVIVAVRRALFLSVASP